MKKEKNKIHARRTISVEVQWRGGRGGVRGHGPSREMKKKSVGHWGDMG